MTLKDWMSDLRAASLALIVVIAISIGFWLIIGSGETYETYEEEFIDNDLSSIAYVEVETSTDPSDFDKLADQLRLDYSDQDAVYARLWSSSSNEYIGELVVSNTYLGEDYTDVEEGEFRLDY